jgi:hypothetical protein
VIAIVIPGTNTPFEKLDPLTQEIFTDIHDGLRDFLEERAGSKNENYYEENIHVSSLYDCKRKVVMSYYNFPKNKLDLSELLMFEIANFVHDLMAQWAAQSKVFKLIGAEEVLSDFLPDMIAGKCDLLMTHTPSGKTLITDTKTAHPKNFEMYSQYLLKASHKNQINTYAMGAKKKGIKVDGRIMTYFDRGGTHDPRFYEIEDIPEEVLMARIDTYKSAVKKYAEDKSLPPLQPLKITLDKTGRVFGTRPWHCDYCKFCTVSCDSYGGFFESKKKVQIGTSDFGFFMVDASFAPMAASLQRQWDTRLEEEG